MAGKGQFVSGTPAPTRSSRRTILNLQTIRVADLITMKVAGKLANLEPNTLRAYAVAGRLPAIRPGEREWFTTVAALEWFLASARQPLGRPRKWPEPPSR